MVISSFLIWPYNLCIVPCIMSFLFWLVRTKLTPIPVWAPENVQMLLMFHYDHTIDTNKIEPYSDPFHSTPYTNFLIIYESSSCLDKTKHLGKELLNSWFVPNFPNCLQHWVPCVLMSIQWAHLQTHDALPLKFSQKPG